MCTYCPEIGEEETPTLQEVMDDYPEETEERPFVCSTCGNQDPYQVGWVREYIFGEGMKHEEWDYAPCPECLEAEEHLAGLRN